MLTKEEIVNIETTMRDLSFYITELRWISHIHFHRKPEIAGRINDLRCCYNRLKEALNNEIYEGEFKYRDDDPTEIKEQTDETNGH